MSQVFAVALAAGLAWVMTRSPRRAVVAAVLVLGLTACAAAT